MPWEKVPVPPEVAACTLCDTHGLVDLLDAEGTRYTKGCCHDAARLQAYVAREGHQLVREDRSREPPEPPQEGGPAP